MRLRDAFAAVAVAMAVRVGGALITCVLETLAHVPGFMSDATRLLLTAERCAAPAAI